MSDNWLHLVPCDPVLRPDPEARKAALAIWARAFPQADQVRARDEAGVVFFDAGVNAESVSCPGCQSELDWSWWSDAMDRAYASGFADLRVVTPCCGTPTTLDDLVYAWPVAFGSFALEAMNPDVGDPPEEIRQEIERVSGVPSGGSVGTSDGRWLIPGRSGPCATEGSVGDRAMDLMERVASGKRDAASLEPAERAAVEEAIARFGVEAILAAPMDVSGRCSLEALMAVAADAELRHADARALADNIRPHRLEEPTILFRSICRHGFADLVERGSFHGMLDAWETGDERRLVFFGDSPRGILGQGEDAWRSTLVSLADHPACVAFRKARDALRAATGPEECRVLDKALTEARRARDRAMEPHVRAEEAARAERAFTSVLVRTRPVTGATVWPRGARGNLMGVAEYGFPDGAVTVEDVAAVSLVKDRRIVAELSFDEAVDAVLGPSAPAPR